MLEKIEMIYNQFIEEFITYEISQLEEQDRSNSMYQSYIEDLRYQALDKYGWSDRDIEHERDRGHTWGEGIDDVVDSDRYDRERIKKNTETRFPWFREYIAAVLERDLSDIYHPYMFYPYNVDEVVEGLVCSEGITSTIDYMTSLITKTIEVGGLDYENEDNTPLCTNV